MNEATNQKTYFIPYEVVTIILGHTLPYKTIMQCRLVCRTWNHIIQHQSWKYVVERKKSQRKPYSDAEIEKISRMPWYLLHAMCSTDGIFGRNLVLTKHRGGSPVWKLTNPDSPCWQTVLSDVKNEKKPNDELSNSDDFFTFKIQVGRLQNSTRTVQVIKLPKCGLSWLILKTLRPKIHVSFWVCLEAGLEAPVDRQERPRYHAIVHLRNSNLDSINEETHHDRSNLIINTDKGFWKKITIKKQQACELKPHLDSIFIEHLLHNAGAKCVVTRLLIRIEKPNLLDADWDSVFKNSNVDSFESLLVPAHSMLVEEATNLRRLQSNLLPVFDTHIELLAFPASGVFIPGTWYGRPLADIITIKDDDVDALTCYDNATHLLLYELKYKINLKEHGLFNFIMDKLQPKIYAYIDSKNVVHRDKMKYEMTVSLLDSEERVMQQQKNSEVLSKLECSRILIQFKNYGLGATYIVINIRRHMSMNKCTQVVHGPTTFTFLNHVRTVVNATKVVVTYGSAFE